tara:strand:- start:75 stop:620 length:546 start_codon:yes stop_codon:yes gene_type:complete
MVCFGVTVSAQKYKSTNHDEVSKTLGDSNFSSNKSLFENLKDAPDFTILSKILKNDQLRKSLENQEMVTIFAIADEAFMNLPKKSRDSILGNKPLLNAMIKYLAIPGRLDSHSLLTAIEKNGGKALLTTVEGQSLEIKEENGQVVLVDSYNNSARIIAPDYYHKNGFFHIVDGFVFPPGSN